MLEMEYRVLSNGYRIPYICFGTDIVDYRTSYTEKMRKELRFVVNTILRKDTKHFKKDKGIVACTKHCLENGCNFFDTSRAYGGSERMLQEALKHQKRNSYYICTKLDNFSQLHDIPARATLEESMCQLGVDYVDVYLLHWPVEGKYLEYWKQLEKLYEEGMVKAIGVSNCKIHHLEEIKKIAEIMPMIDEVELHPLLSEVDLRHYCEMNKIQVMAYTSTARLDFRLKASRRMEQVCKETHKSLSQVILRWHIQNGVIPIFNTSTVDHFKNNMDIFDFALSDVQMKVIDSMNINARTRYDSDNCEWDRL